MYVSVIFDCDPSVRKVIPKHWVKKQQTFYEKNEYQIIFYSENSEAKPYFKLECYKREFGLELEGNYKVFIKGQFGK
jgi:hypothetical protein